MSTFPSSIDTDTPSSGTSLLTSPDHSNRHNVHGSAITNIETKLGVGSGTPTAGRILSGSGNGTSTWGTSWNNGVLGTPAITGGTISGANINSSTLGTPTIAVGSDAQGDIYYRSSGGGVARLAPGTAGQALKTGGAGANPSYGNVIPVVVTTTSTNDYLSGSTSYQDSSATASAATITTTGTTNILITATLGAQQEAGTSYYSLGIGKGVNSAIITRLIDPPHQAIGNACTLTYMDMSVAPGTYVYHMGGFVSAGTLRILSGSNLTVIALPT